jgi:hypothetical protein
MALLDLLLNPAFARFMTSVEMQQQLDLGRLFEFVLGAESV